MQNLKSGLVTTSHGFEVLLHRQYLILLTVCTPVRRETVYCDCLAHACMHAYTRKVHVKCMIMTQIRVPYPSMATLPNHIS